ncbi:hypothetical protein [Cellulosilyticum ruminicola]|nr:hypothetical protein [Cellulosilyticum ruminicola]
MDVRNKELTLEMVATQAIAAYQYWLKNPYDIEKLIRRTLQAYTNQ